jgi:hypothetical protein
MACSRYGQDGAAVALGVAHERQTRNIAGGRSDHPSSSFPDEAILNCRFRTASRHDGRIALLPLHFGHHSGKCKIARPAKAWNLLSLLAPEQT